MINHQLININQFYLLQSSIQESPACLASPLSFVPHWLVTIKLLIKTLINHSLNLISNYQIEVEQLIELTNQRVLIISFFEFLYVYYSENN